VLVVPAADTSGHITAQVWTDSAGNSYSCGRGKAQRRGLLRLGAAVRRRHVGSLPRRRRASIRPCARRRCSPTPVGSTAGNSPAWAVGLCGKPAAPAVQPGKRRDQLPARRLDDVQRRHDAQPNLRPHPRGRQQPDRLRHDDHRRSRPGPADPAARARGARQPGPGRHRPREGRPLRRAAGTRRLHRGPPARRPGSGFRPRPSAAASPSGRTRTRSSCTARSPTRPSFRRGRAPSAGPSSSPSR